MSKDNLDGAGTGFIKLDFLQNSLGSATLVPNKTRLKPSAPSFARSLLSLIENIDYLDLE